MTLYEAYCFGEQELKNRNIDDASLDAWYLLEFATGISRARYYSDKDHIISAIQIEKYQEYIKRRASYIPLQHITGVQEFMGLEFEVNGHVLIPRQDTEVLVETILDYCNKKKFSNIRILDMCTGSGCILISLLRILEKRNATGVGSDVSGEALAVAKKNAVKNQVEMKAAFVESDLFDKIEGTYDIIVSNPPYIRTNVIEDLQTEVKMHDPWIALDGKEDGLYFYRKIIKDSTKYLRENGWLFFEIGYNQAEEVISLMEKEQYINISVKKDLAGLDRVVCGVYNKAKK